MPANSHRPSGLDASDWTARFCRPPDTFTQVWPPSVLRSTPWPPFTSPFAVYEDVAAYQVPGLDGIGTTSDTRQLLTLLASGLKDDAIARQLGLSTRTMRRRIRTLLDELSAANRFQAGVQAARRGWL